MFTLINPLKKASSTVVLVCIFIFSLSLFLMPSVTFANDPTGGPQVESVSLDNPLNVDTIEELISGILNIVLILSVPVIVFFIIYSGFLYVTARGNPEQLKKATTALTYAIIGGVLIIGAVAIAEIVKELVNSFKA